MSYLETVFIEGSAGAVLDSAAGTPNGQALTIQGNASGVPVPVSGTLTSTILGVATVSGVVGATQAGTFAVSSTQGGSWAVSATQGTSPWVTTSTIQGTAAVQGVIGATQAGVFAVASTQGGSWAVSATQGTSPWVTTATIQGTIPVSLAGVIGTTQAGTFAVASTQGGSWAVSATQGTSPWVTTSTIQGTANENLLAVGGILLGTTAVTLYGSIPAASTVPGVNAYITNSPAVTQGGSWAVSATQGTTPWVTTATLQGAIALAGVVGTTQAGTFAVASTQGGSWAVAATQGTSPWVTTATISGTANENLTAVGGILLGTTAVTLYGSTPAASTVPGVNAYITNSPAVTQGGTFAVVATQGGAYAVAATQAGAFAVASTQGGSWAVAATQGTSPWVCTATVSGTAAENLLAVGGILLGTTAVTLYGSIPAASTVPGVNAFVTNIVTTTQANQAVTQGGVFAVAATQGGTYAVASTQAGTFAVASTQAGTFAVASTQGGSWAISATQGTSPWVTTASVFGHLGGIMDAVITVTTAPANGLMTLVTYTTAPPTLTTGQSVGATCDVVGSHYVDTEGRKNTYRVALDNVTLATSSFPTYTLYANGTKTVKFTKIDLTASAATPLQSIVFLGLTPALWSGGTTATLSIAKMDPNNPASTMAVSIYSVSATGGGTGNVNFVAKSLITENTTVTSTAVQSPNANYVEVFGDGVGRQPPVLRTSAQGLSIFTSGIVIITGFVEWTEE